MKKIVKYGIMTMMKLQMSKKRNHKIKITDVAIEKVPYIKYHGFPKEECKIIQQLAKETLTISKEENSSNEVAIMYLPSCSKLTLELKDSISISLGTEHYVDPLSNSQAIKLLKKSKGCVMILLHNHPNLSKFSVLDIDFFINCYQLKLMIVVTNAGAVSYLLKKDSYNVNKAIEISNVALEMSSKAKNIKQLQDAAKYFLKKCKKCGIYYSE